MNLQILMESFILNNLILIEFYSMICSGVAIPILIFLCIKKKATKSTKSARPSKKSKKEKKNRKSKRCNVKSGLLNDDPDLKSHVPKNNATQTSSPPPLGTPNNNNRSEDNQSTDLASNIFPGGIKPRKNSPMVPSPTSTEHCPKTGVAAETRVEGSKTMIGQFIPNKSHFAADKNNNNLGGGGTAVGQPSPVAPSVFNREDGTQIPGNTNVDMNTPNLTPAA